MPTINTHRSYFSFQIYPLLVRPYKQSIINISREKERQTDTDRHRQTSYLYGHIEGQTYKQNRHETTTIAKK